MSPRQHTLGVTCIETYILKTWEARVQVGVNQLILSFPAEGLLQRSNQRYFFKFKPSFSK